MEDLYQQIGKHYFIGNTSDYVNINVLSFDLKKDLSAGFSYTGNW